MRPRTICIHQPTYLPWLGFFDKLLACDAWVVLDDAELTRQSWITRVNIRNGQAPLLLSVPVLHRFSEHAPLRDIRIDASRNWRRKHEKAIRQAYSRCPFFDELEPLMALTFATDHARLIDLTLTGVEWLCKTLGIAIETVFSSQYALDGVTGSARLVALTRAAGGAIYVTGSGSRGYLTPCVFQTAGLGLAWQDYVEQPYGQVGGGDFTGRLSAIDALANLGATATAGLLRRGHRPPIAEVATP